MVPLDLPVSLRALGVAMVLAPPGCVDETLRGQPCEDSTDCGALHCLAGVCDAPPPGPETSPGCDFEGEMELADGRHEDDRLVTSADDHRGSCGGRGAPELAYTFVAPFTGRFHVRVELAAEVWAAGQAEPVVYVREAGCGGQELACGRGDRGTRSFEAEEGQTYFLFVDDLFPGRDAGADGLAVVVEPDDACAAAPLLPGPSLPQMIAGTVDPGPSTLAAGPCGGGGLGAGPEALHRFRAPADGTFSFHVATDAFDPVVSVVSGGCGARVHDCNDDVSGASNGAGATAVARLEEGEEALVLVDSNAGAGGPYTLEVRDAFECVPPGNHLPDGLPVAGVPFAAADAASVDLPAFGGTGGPVLTWRYRAPEGGVHSVYAAATDGNELSAEVALYRSCAGPLLAADLGREPGAVPGQVPSVRDGAADTPLTEGEEVLIVVRPLVGDGGALRQTTRTCADLITSPKAGFSIGLGNVFSAYRSVKTLNGSCPSHAGIASLDGGFYYTAPRTGRYRFSTDFTNNIGDHDTVLIVREATCSGRQLACNDDSPDPLEAEAGWSRTELWLRADQRVLVLGSGANASQEHDFMNYRVQVLE